MSTNLIKIVFVISVMFASTVVRAEGMTDDITRLEHGWAKAYYLTPDDKKDQEFTALEASAHAISNKYRGHAEPIVWEGIITSTHAKFEGMFAAGKSAKAARDLLLQAEKMDPNALEGSVYVSLGSLYYKVPGWPLSFGDKKKAKDYLERGLKISPSGIDSNFFYGEFLSEQGDKAKAIVHLKKALSAPARIGREDADAGRHLEIKALLKTLGV